MNEAFSFLLLTALYVLHTGGLKLGYPSACIHEMVRDKDKGLNVSQRHKTGHKLSPPHFFA